MRPAPATSSMLSASCARENTQPGAARPARLVHPVRVGAAGPDERAVNVKRDKEVAQVRHRGAAAGGRRGALSGARDPRIARHSRQPRASLAQMTPRRPPGRLLTRRNERSLQLWCRRPDSAGDGGERHPRSAVGGARRERTAAAACGAAHRAQRRERSDCRQGGRACAARTAAAVNPRAAMRHAAEPRACPSNTAASARGWADNSRLRTACALLSPAHARRADASNSAPSPLRQQQPPCARREALPRAACRPEQARAWRTRT